MSAEAWAYGPAPKKRGFIRRHTTALVVGLCMSMAGFALGAWLVDGSGNAFRRLPVMQSPQGVDLTDAEITTDPNCTPGSTGPGGSLYGCTLQFKVNNPNQAPVYLFGVQGFIVQPLGACDSSNFVTNPAPIIWSPGLRFDPGISTVELPNLLGLKDTAQTTCQGTVVRVNASNWHFSNSPTATN